MSLSLFSYGAMTIRELQNWFTDIYNHLSAKNYDNKTWTPTITGMTGTPTVTANYQRFGKRCDFVININGTHTMADATVSLPITAVGEGNAVMHSITDNSTIGTAVVDSSDGLLHIKTYWVTDEEVIINGFYEVAGI